MLQGLKERLADARRDLRRADQAEQARIRDEIAQLERDLAEQQRIVDDPRAAARRAEESITRGIERERQREKPLGGVTQRRFMNPPPSVAPTYFQNRHVETNLIGDFLKDESRRLMTVVGRAGIGKTAMVCRLLKGLESGHLPDDGGQLSVYGIVYLSTTGSRRVNVPNLYADLSRLLPEDTSHQLDILYKDPLSNTASKMQALLAEFPTGLTVLLLDNFEDVIDSETFDIRDVELDEALRALLNLPHHAVKVILTTRLAPRALALVQPGRQTRLDLDEGLPHPFAENILREMDTDGKVGLKTAPADLLAEARERTRGYPRALEALFAILSADRYTTLQEVLKDAERLLPENVVEILVGEAFDRLDLTTEKVMQALAIYARPVTSAAVDYLLQPHLPGVNSTPVLNRLVTMKFVRKETGRYYLHPVDRAYAFKLLPRGQEADRLEEDAPPFTQFALLHRGAEYFHNTRTPPESWKTIDDLTPQLAEFDLRYSGQDYNQAARVLLELDAYPLLWGYYRLVAQLHERLQNQLSDPRLKLSSMGNLARAYHSTGHYQQAITYHEQAIAVARQVEDRSGEGRNLGSLALNYTALGQTARAIDYLEQALAIAREIGDRSGEGRHLGSLALNYSALGQTARAIDYLEQALAIAREIGDRSGEGRHLGNLALNYAALGQTARAIDYLEQALAIAREIGDRSGEGRHLGNLALNYAALGQTARAIDYFEQALAIFCEIGHQLGKGQHLGNLARILTDEERYNEAVQRALESVKIADAIRSPLIASYSNSYLARAYLYSGDLPAARTAIEAARTHDEPRNNHNALALLGLIALRQGDRSMGQEAFTAAVAQADVFLKDTAQDYDALDAKGLACCGLALCGKRQYLPLAMDAYRAGRAINRDAGIVQRVLRLLEALAAADPAGVDILSGAWAAASGK